MNFARIVAGLITEDPDIFLEFDQGLSMAAPGTLTAPQPPLTAADMKQAEKMPEDDDVMKKENDKQDRLDKNKQLQRKKILDRQMQDMQKKIDGIQDTVKRQAELAKNNTDTDIGGEMAQLEKALQLYNAQATA